MKLIYALVLISMLSSVSSAYATSMICLDSGKGFKLSFDPASKVMKSARPGSDYTVTSMEGSLVSGTTVADGPTFRAQFEGQKRLEYYYHGKLMQYCSAVRNDENIGSSYRCPRGVGKARPYKFAAADLATSSRSTMRTPILLAAAMSLAALSTPAFAKHHRHKHHHKHGKTMSTEAGPPDGASQTSSDMRGPGTAGSSGMSAGPATGAGSRSADPTATSRHPDGNYSKN